MSGGRPEWSTVSTSATLNEAAAHLRGLTQATDLARVGLQSHQVAESVADLIETIAWSLPLPDIEDLALDVATKILTAGKTAS